MEDDTPFDILFDRIDKIETLDDFIDWVRDMSAAAEKDELEIENPWTPAYLECMSAFMTDTMDITPFEVRDGSISLKSMARVLISSLTYE